MLRVVVKTHCKDCGHDISIWGGGGRVENYSYITVNLPNTLKSVLKTVSRGAWVAWSVKQPTVDFG